MAKEKTGQEVGATVDVKPEEVAVTAALQAGIEALRAESNKVNAEIQVAQAELATAQERNTKLERLLETGLAPGDISDGETLTSEAETVFYTGSGTPAVDTEVVAIKSKHGHAFFRADYRVQPHWTFMRRADFGPADFERPIGDCMVEAHEALPTDAS